MRISAYVFHVCDDDSDDDDWLIAGSLQAQSRAYAMCVCVGVVRVCECCSQVVVHKEWPAVAVRGM